MMIYRRIVVSLAVSISSFSLFFVPLNAEEQGGIIFSKAVELPLQGSVVDVAAVSGDLIYGGDRLNQLLAWNQKTGDLRWNVVLSCDGCLPSPVTGLAVSPDGLMLAAGTKEGNLFVVRADDGKVLRVHTLDKRRAIANIEFAPRGDVVAYSDSVGRVWQMDYLQGHRELIAELDWAAIDLQYADEEFLMIAERSRFALWNIPQKKLVRDLVQSEGGVSIFWLSTIGFSEDLTKVILGAGTKAHLFNLIDGTLMKTYDTGAEGNIRYAALSFDKNEVLLAESSGAITVWDAMGGNRTGLFLPFNFSIPNGLWALPEPRRFLLSGADILIPSMQAKPTAAVWQY